MPEPLVFESSLVPPEFRRYGTFVCGIKNPADDFCDVFLLDAADGSYFLRFPDGHYYGCKYVDEEEALRCAKLMKELSPEWFISRSRPMSRAA